MDSVDVRLIRAMYLDGTFQLRGVDPRLTARSLGQKVGANRITVARRLALWRSEGFYRGVTVFPNPDALGTSFQMQGLILEPSRNRHRLESALDDVLDCALVTQTEDFYAVILLKESASQERRRQKALEELGICRIISPPLDVPFLPSEVSLGPRDWQILRALRKLREPDWKVVAHEVGVTVRGLQRRITRLIDGRALFFFPSLDFRRSPGTVAMVGILTRVGADTTRVRAEVERRHPDLLPVEKVFPFEKFLPPGDLPPVGGGIPFWLPVPAASSADELRREFCAMPDVLEVIISFPTQNYALPRAFERRIELAAAASGSSPGLAPRAPHPGFRAAGSGS